MALGSSESNETTGQLVQITTPSGDILDLGYDGFLHTTSTWSGADEVAGSVVRGYDSDFRVSSVSVNGTPLASYGYDADSLLTSAGSMSISRDVDNGQVAGTTLGSVATTRAYNGFGEVDTFTADDADGALYDYAITARDKLGRITEKTETVLGETHTYGYVYDDADRLSTVFVDGDQVRQYDYDANGNRLQRTSASGTESGSYDAQDRMLSYGDWDYTYRDNGQLLTKTDTSSGEETMYDYDLLGNLRAVHQPDGTTIGYEVDGKQRRVGKRVDGAVVKRWLYLDQLNPIAELDAGNNVVSTFIYATHPHVPDFMVKNGATYRLITDHLGSVRLVVNTSTGEVVQRLGYDEFGRVLLDTNPGFQPFAFAGGLYDPDTGLVRFGARDYDAQSGRWTAKDPIGFQGGYANLYVYAGSDPINRTDSTGMDDTSDCIKTCAATSAGATTLGVCRAPGGPAKAIRFLSGLLSFSACTVAKCGFGVDPKEVPEKLRKRMEDAQPGGTGYGGQGAGG